MRNLILTMLLIVSTFIVNGQENTLRAEYAKDAEFKIDYINDILAAKEMYIGRFYFQKKIYFCKFKHHCCKIKM